MVQDTIHVAAPSVSKSGTTRHIFRHLFGYLLAFLCFVWVFHDVNYRVLWRDASSINWWWIAPAVFCDILGYVFQGQRWQMLLRHLGRITVTDTTKAIYAGLFTNEVIPLRMGEVLRTLLISRWLSIRFIAAIPSVIIERLFDAIWLGIVLGVTAIALEEFPEEMLQTAGIVGIAILLMTGLFTYLVFFRKNTNTDVPNRYVDWKPLRIIISFWKQIGDEVNALAKSRMLHLSFLTSSMVLACQMLAFYFVIRGYGLNSSFLVGTAVFLFIRVGTLIPSAPSNVGTYQFLCVSGLMFFGTDKTTACAFSMVVFIIITVPLWAVGLFAFSRCNLTMAQIRHEMRKLGDKIDSRTGSRGKSL